MGNERVEVRNLPLERGVGGGGVGELVIRFSGHAAVFGPSAQRLHFTFGHSSHIFYSCLLKCLLIVSSETHARRLEAKSLCRLNVSAVDNFIAKLLGYTVLSATRMSCRPKYALC